MNHSGKNAAIPVAVGSVVVVVMAVAAAALVKAVTAVDVHTVALALVMAWAIAAKLLETAASLLVRLLASAAMVVLIA